MSIVSLWTYPRKYLHTHCSAFLDDVQVTLSHHTECEGRVQRVQDVRKAHERAHDRSLCLDTWRVRREGKGREGGEEKKGKEEEEEDREEERREG